MNATKEVFDVYTFAYEVAKRRLDEYVTAEHLLYAILEESDPVCAALESMGADIDTMQRKLLAYLDDNVEKVTSEEKITDSISFGECFVIAEHLAKASDRQAIEVEHMMAALFQLEESYAGFLIEEQGITLRDFLYEFYHEPGIQENDYEEPAAENREEQIIERFTVNLNEEVKKDTYEPLIGRKDILEQTIQILCRKQKNNPIHVGEPGVGKTAVTLGLADRINKKKVPRKLKNSIIYSLDLASLLAGTKYRGDFEERMKQILDILDKKGDAIVYIDEIHTVVGAGAIGEGTMDASNLIKPYLAAGSLRFIGATTYDEYKKYFEKDKGLTRRFRKIDVKETTQEETKEILMRIKPSYEKFHNVVYTDKAIEAAIDLSRKYMADHYLPDKAIDLLDEAGAFLDSGFAKGRRGNTVDESLMEKIVSRSCSIPVQAIEKDEVKELRKLKETLQGQIFGQNAAVEKVVECIQLSRAGLKEENKPIASMLFVGPTGVGKTELAKCLADALSINLVRFDMSEYGEKHTASKLIGAPPGYVGYEEGGLLTDAVRRKPYCVLLLDEIEKAHEDVMNVLLQIMDYASLTDNKGRTTDFKNVILIMTSNAGARQIGKNRVGFNQNEIGSEILSEEVKRVFPPEFRNRLDGIIPFAHISEEMAVKIVEKEWKQLKGQLKKKKVELKISKRLTRHVVEKGISREYGAREIKRFIHAEVKSVLVEELLFGNLKNGGLGKLDYIDGNVTLRCVEKTAE